MTLFPLPFRQEPCRPSRLPGRTGSFVETPHMSADAPPPLINSVDSMTALIRDRQVPWTVERAATKQVRGPQSKDGAEARAEQRSPPDKPTPLSPARASGCRIPALKGNCNERRVHRIDVHTVGCSRATLRSAGQELATITRGSRSQGSSFRPSQPLVGQS